MSFFDEADDEPQQPPRTQSRRPSSAPRSSGGRGGGRPPRNSQHQQSVQNRRIVLGVAVVVVVILMAVLIHGCAASQATNSLKDYSNNVYQLIGASDSNGAKVWSTLESSKNATTLENELGVELSAARSQLTQAENLSAPGSMAKAQQNLLTVMQERQDGIKQISSNISEALNTQTSKDGVYALAVGTALLFSSDVIYKNYVTRQLAEGLHGDSIQVCPVGSGSSCGDGAVAINPGQIVNDLGWLQQSFIAAKLGAGTSSTSGSQTSTSSANGHQSGLHGDQINAASTTVDGTTLSTSGTTAITQSGPPTFTLSVTNGGDFKQQPTCRVSVDGITATAETGVILSQGTGTCTVKLPKQVPAGTYTVTADVEKVYGETDITNNTATYSVQFK